MFLFSAAKHVRRVALRATCLRKWRDLHIHLSTANGLAKLEHEATHLSLGVGFIAAYTPNTSSCVWVQPHDCSSNLFGELGLWHRLQVPSADRAPLGEVACGRAHLVALTTEGEVYTAGLNTLGQCGSGAVSANGERSLSHVTGLTEQISHVACGLDHTLFLSESGRVFSCGWSADGQTGVGSYLNVSSPTEVLLPFDLHFSDVYTCADSAFAKTSRSHVYGWGNNEYGQLAMSFSEDGHISKPLPLDLPHLDGELVSIATGGAFTAFLTSSGSVYIVGYSIEEPSLSHNQATGKLLSPQHMCQVRKLHDGQTSGYICAIHAGLHYLVGEVSSQELIVWGQYPDSGERERTSSWSRKIKLDSRVLNIAYGPSSIAVLSSDNNINNLMSFS